MIAAAAWKFFSQSMGQTLIFYSLTAGRPRRAGEKISLLSRSFAEELPRHLQDDGGTRYKNGGDVHAQLERAIAELLERLQESPPANVPRPVPPDRAPR